MLFPGAAVEVVTGGATARAGIAAFIASGNAVFIVTCGHAFPSPGELRLAGKIVGRGTHNLLAAERVDVALCRLTNAGAQFALAGRHAPTWFSHVHRPVPADAGATATFHPTRLHHGPAFAIDVESHQDCRTIQGANLCGLV